MEWNLLMIEEKLKVKLHFSFIGNILITDKGQGKIHISILKENKM